jgi:hypothetical protein
MSARGDCIAAKKEFDVCEEVRKVVHDKCSLNICLPVGALKKDGILETLYLIGNC